MSKVNSLGLQIRLAAVLQDLGAHDEPQCKLVCPADCIVVNPDFAESPEQLQEKYMSLHG